MVNAALVAAMPETLTSRADGGGGWSNCTLADCPVELSVYGYRPSLAASGTLMALYAIFVAIHVSLGFRYKTWGFMCAMVLGCVDETLGYGGRVMLWQNPWNHTGFIMQIVLITIGPVFFAAAIYVLLHHVVMFISPRFSRFRPVLFYYIFIPCDIISLILQAAGGAMSSSSNGTSDTGVKIAMAGLSFQVITLVTFIGLTIDYAIRSRFVWRCIKLPTRFKVFSGFLALATLLVLLRCCYRIYEVDEGYSQDSAALRDQPLFIALGSVMVVVAAFALIVAHPGPVFKAVVHPLSEQEEREAGIETESKTLNLQLTSPAQSPHSAVRV